MLLHGDEETPFVDDQAAAEDEFAATAETGYKYVYAGSDMGTVLGI